MQIGSHIWCLSAEGVAQDEIRPKVFRDSETLATVLDLVYRVGPSGRTKSYRQFEWSMVEVRNLGR